MIIMENRLHKNWILFVTDLKTRSSLGETAPCHCKLAGVFSLTP